MVLGTTTEKTRSVGRKSARNPDFLWRLLASCDVPGPTGTRNDGVSWYGIYHHCRNAFMRLCRRFAVCAMDLGLQVRNFPASSNSSSLVHRLLNPLGFGAFKMGRLRGGRKE